MDLIVRARGFKVTRRLGIEVQRVRKGHGGMSTTWDQGSRDWCRRYRRSRLRKAPVNVFVITFGRMHVVMGA